jgi:methylase of polypeptide subunit release factors
MSSLILPSLWQLHTSPHLTLSLLALSTHSTNREEQPSTLVEFGAGDGSPVISTLLKAPFTGTIHAFELNPRAAQVAHSRAEQFSLAKKYKVHNGCFFKGQKTVGAECLIANPPYLPAPGKKGATK